jgi:hypothetical protein
LVARFADRIGVVAHLYGEALDVLIGGLDDLDAVKVKQLAMG